MTISKEAIGRENVFSVIGRFIFEFSQLEFTFKHHLAEGINLDDRFFEPVMAGYDFALLCRATVAVWDGQLTSEQSKQLEKLVKRCLKLNDERVRVAHGLWIVDQTGGEAHHLSRNTLKSSRHFEDPSELVNLTELAAQLRIELTKIFYGLPMPKRHPGMKKTPPA